MKELLEKIVRYLPQYFMDFGAAFSGPKAFIGQKNLDGGDAFGDALLFAGLSVVLVILMAAPRQPPGTDLWNFVGGVMVLTIMTLALSASCVRTAWWLVGGRANARSFFVAAAYFFGVVVVIFSAFQLVSLGVLKS